MQILQQRNTELLTLGWGDFEQFLNEAVLDWIFVQSMTNQLKTINPIVVLSGQSISSWYFSFSNQSKEHIHLRTNTISLDVEDTGKLYSRSSPQKTQSTYPQPLEPVYHLT